MYKLRFGVESEKAKAVTGPLKSGTTPDDRKLSCRCIFPNVQSAVHSAGSILALSPSRHYRWTLVAELEDCGTFDSIRRCERDANPVHSAEYLRHITPS
jgi:hypothetical protein